MSPAQESFAAEVAARRKRRLFRTAEQDKKAIEFEMPGNFMSRIVRKSLLRQTQVARGSGEGASRGSHFHRIEFPCVLQSAARLMLWDIKNKLGPHKCGIHEVFSWEVNTENQEELDNFCQSSSTSCGRARRRRTTVG